MLKMIVVDDEMLVCEMIKRCVDWSEIGFEILGTASTADEGEALVDSKRPDLLITDVRMPRRTGLELARCVLEKYPDMKVIVVSGYDEFDYVNEGLKIGIFDYILKPIADDVLRDVACRVRDAILKERSHAEEFARFKKEFEQNYTFIRERQIERLVSSPNPDTVVENLEFFGIRLQKDCFQIATLEYKTDEEVNQEMDLLQSIQVRSMVDEFIKPYPCVLAFERHFQRLILINNNRDIDFIDVCETLRKTLNHRLGIHARIGIGQRYADIRQLSVSYQEASDALKYDFAMNPESCICYHDVVARMNVGDGGQEGIQEGIYHRIGYYVKQGMMKEAMASVDDIFSAAEASAISRDQAVFIAISCTIEALTSAAELKIDTEETDHPQTDIILRIIGLRTLTEMHQQVSLLLRQISEAFMRQNETKTANVVKTAEEYVADNYNNPDLSLSQIASAFYVNPNHLSRVFKERTGKTFRKYLLELRMNNAVVLLRQTSLKAYEVAEKVGFKDPSYFSACFKKEFGYSIQKMNRE